MSTLQPLTLLTLSSALVVGLVQALLGNLKQQLARRSDLPDPQFNRLLSAVNFSLLPVMLAAGLLVDLWGVRPALLAGSVLLALSFLAFSAGLAYWRTLIATITAALGASAVTLSALVLMPAGLFGKDQVAASVQLGMVVVALGALVTPPLFDLLASTINFRRSMALLSLLMLAPAFLTALPFRQEELPAPENVEKAALAVWPVFDDGRVWMAGLVACFYAPLEACISVWATNFLGRRNQVDRESRWLAYFWGSMLLSRLLLALLQHNYLGDKYNGLYLVLLVALATVLLGNLSSVSRLDNAVPGLIGLGLFLGPVYPLLLAMVLGIHSAPGAAGTALALLHVMGALGSLLIVPLIGFSLRAQTLAGGLRLLLVLAGGCVRVKVRSIAPPITARQSPTASSRTAAP